MNPSKYSAGDVIVLREIWDGKIWTAIPTLVVQDNKDLIALYIPIGTCWKRHQSLNEGTNVPHDRKNKNWILRDMVWESRFPYLKLTIPFESYSIFLFRNDQNDSLRFWYVNLEDPESPIHSTAIGFDSTDMLLDIIVESNLKDWRWEDEDELQEAVEIGLINKEKALSLYAKGEEVRNLIMSGKSIFNGWKDWHPDPSWKVPILPDGWDVI